MMDLRTYRQRPEEQERIADLMDLLPPARTALDVGAREGYISRQLATVYEEVVALDLVLPPIQEQRITCVVGDVTALDYADDSFDTVVCTEVLEHIPPHLLAKACAEITRVAAQHVLIGVPYRQDTRVGRTTCRACGHHNPPWGHVNVFDEQRLERLFGGLRLEQISLVGETRERTNALSAFLLDLAGNPYGTRDQDEKCLCCGAALSAPPERTLLQKLYTRAGCMIQSMQRPFIPTRPNWIHVLFSKVRAGTARPVGSAR